MDSTTREQILSKIDHQHETDNGIKCYYAPAVYIAMEEYVNHKTSALQTENTSLRKQVEILELEKELVRVNCKFTSDLYCLNQKSEFRKKIIELKKQLKELKGE